MTGVPGGDVTLHAAITEAIRNEATYTYRGDDGGPLVAWREPEDLADRLLAVLADRLPHTPPAQLATLIGGTGTHGFTIHYSPPAAPEPQCTCYFTPRVLAPPCPRHPAAPEPQQDDPDPLADPEYVAWLKAGRPPHPLPAAPTEEPTPHDQ